METTRWSEEKWQDSLLSKSRLRENQEYYAFPPNNNNRFLTQHSNQEYELDERIYQLSCGNDE